MNKKAKLTGVMLAIGAASVFALTPVIATASSSKVNCYGVNSCKGKSSCKTAQNACKGKNSCKGHGVVKMSAKRCAKKGGTTDAPEATTDETPAQ
jgi:hypothetical protein